MAVRSQPASAALLQKPKTLSNQWSALRSSTQLSQRNSSRKARRGHKGKQGIYTRAVGPSDANIHFDSSIISNPNVLRDLRVLCGQFLISEF
jgi:hypothetical protein